MQIDKSHYNENGSLWKNCAYCSNCPIESTKLCIKLSKLQECKRAKALLKEQQKRNKK